MKIIDGLDLANQQIQNLADGSSPTDAVTLQQMQAFVRGLDWKASVRAASTANVNVSSAPSTLDGVTLASGDRVLLKNQTTGSQNGLYGFTAAGAALTRTADGSTQDGVQTLTSGAAVLVTEGTTLGDTAWVLTTDDPLTIGTTSLTFNQFGGGTSYTQGNGISIVGTVITAVAAASGGISVVSGGIKVDFTIVPAKYSVSIGNGSLTTFTINHALGTSDVLVSVREVSSGIISYMGPVIVDSNNLTLTFPSAPTSNQYRVSVHG